jgi:hypothetical protein
MAFGSLYNILAVPGHGVLIFNFSIVGLYGIWFFSITQQDALHKNKIRITSCRI